MTTSAVTAPRALTTYLRRATWGLPPARQQELWDELEEHALTRTEHLTLTGLSPTQAMTQAIHELGPPARVTLGMAKVYTMPKLLLAAGTLALAVSAGLYALAGGDRPALAIPVFEQPRVGQLCTADTAQAPALALPVASRSDSKICYRLDESIDLTFKPALISVDSARTVMTALGGSVKVRPDGKVELGRPNGTYSRGEFAFNDGQQDYLFASLLFDTLINTRERGDSVTLTGFTQPTLTINSTRVQLVGGIGGKVGTSIYSSLLGEVVSAVIYRNSDRGFSFQTSAPGSAAPTHTIRTTIQPGEVVALLSQSGKDKFVTDFSPVAADGTIRVKSAAPRLRFVTDSAALTTRMGDRSPALLVRMTNIPLNNLKSGIFVPAQATSDAR